MKITLLFLFFMGFFCFGQVDYQEFTWRYKYNAQSEVPTLLDSPVEMGSNIITRIGDEVKIQVLGPEKIGERTFHYAITYETRRVEREWFIKNVITTTHRHEHSCSTNIKLYLSVGPCVEITAKDQSILVKLNRQEVDYVALYSGSIEVKNVWNLYKDLSPTDNEIEHRNQTKRK